jgi:hypothetical protein
MVAVDMAKLQKNDGRIALKSCFGKVVRHIIAIRNARQMNGR